MKSLGAQAKMTDWSLGNHSVVMSAGPPKLAINAKQAPPVEYSVASRQRFC